MINQCPTVSVARTELDGIPASMGRRRLKSTPDPISTTPPPTDH